MSPHRKTDFDLDFLASGDNQEFDDFRLDELIQGGGGDAPSEQNSDAVTILLSVLLGCAAALGLLFVVNHYTNLPETISQRVMQRAEVPILLKKGEIEHSRKVVGSPRGGGGGDPRTGRPVVHGPVNLKSATGPSPMSTSATSSAKIRDLQKSPGFLSKMAGSVSSPQLPRVPRAGNVKGADKVLQSNGALFATVQDGSLRGKLAQSIVGIRPVSDEIDRFSFHTSRGHTMSDERIADYKKQISMNINKINKSGTRPLMFDLPSELTDLPVSAGQRRRQNDHVIGSSLVVEKQV
jgi:hypothetical protein